MLPTVVSAMDKRIQQFLNESFTEGTYYHTLQSFLISRFDKGLSAATVARLYYNLHRIANGKPGSLENAPIQQITRVWLKSYVKNCWLTYAPDTMRTMIGDIRQFFRWAKKHGYTAKNLAKPIKPVKAKRRRRRKSKAPPENDIYTLMRETAVPLVNQGLLYRNFFGELETNIEEWPYTAVHQLRDLLIITLIYETGCRAGEVANLSSKAMDEATDKRQPIYLITSIGKTGDQDYYFTQATANLWHVWQKVRPEGNGRHAVVSWRRGSKPEKLKSNTISNMLVRRCAVHGLRPFRTHSLRHAKTRRSRKLVGIELTSFLIGHADYDTTVGYDYIDDEELIDAVKKTGLDPTKQPI